MKLMTAVFALTFLLVGCATSPAPVPEVNPDPTPKMQNFRAKTDDLGMVADEALQLADRLGKEQVLVVFDIDNTLLAMRQGLGSDQWYYWQKDLEKEDPCNSMLVTNRLKVQGALFFAGAMRTTQPDTVVQVNRVQDAGLNVIAVTSRGPEFRLQTFRELRRNGISFWPSALPPQRGWPESFVPEGGTRPALYEDGVFLTAGQHKGDMIKALLNKTETPSPAVIVMADDKGYSLSDTMEAFAGSGTAVHGWRYSREDANVAAFDGVEAAAQWNELLPALKKIEQILGPDNFVLPAAVVREGCGVN